MPDSPTRTSVVTHVLIALGIGLLSSVFLYFGRAPVVRAVAVGPVIAVATFVMLRATQLGRMVWPEPADDRVGRFDRIQRWRLNGFDAAVDKVPGFSPHLRVRLRELASSILLRYGVEPGSPAAVTLLGPRTHDLLYPADQQSGQDRRDQPIGDELLTLIDTLIELDEQSRPTRTVGAVGPPATLTTKGNR